MNVLEIISDMKTIIKDLKETYQVNIVYTIE